MNERDEKVEVLKVWYSVFCTLVDAYQSEEYTTNDFCHKMVTLRSELASRIPEVEAEMKRHKQ
jgi:hypothetical protein